MKVVEGDAVEGDAFEGDAVGGKVVLPSTVSGYGMVVAAPTSTK